ncbi:MAG: DUF6268 family outer membrane beta-barrel protein [Candidatus Pseudobacter hemicellulosilyticus]|uniref:DUF6268 family outer membrane beta-barrel protein n=1 Tax=Candidatus Pseudobacter hemicellulosilyticus TaxID=3121375 RepID=A0AAJ5WP88_9BACT|nr:MAG: DUF6268 family outer membrane beta-barrel protein [Pseudobacter sp.]
MLIKVGLKKWVFVAITIIHCAAVNAQLSYKTEFIGRSGYRRTEDDRSERVGDSKGSAMVHQAAVTIPLSVKLNEKKQPTMWAISMGGAYAKLNNRNFTEPLVIDEIMNVSVGVVHKRPLNEHWSVLAAVGGGIYMPGARLSDMKLKNVLGSAGTIFIYHLKPNLDIGAGLALNNSFGFPMLFPAFYLDWKTTSKYAVKVEVMKGLEVSVSYIAHKNLSVSFVAEMNGQMALLEQTGEDKIFSHQYLVTGFRPEIKIGKHIMVPLTVGLSATRPAKMMDRKLKSIFQEEGYHFRAAGYASAGVQVKF